MHGDTVMWLVHPMYMQELRRLSGARMQIETQKQKVRGTVVNIINLIVLHLHMCVFDLNADFINLF